jgi:hypothetical protein
MKNSTFAFWILVAGLFLPISFSGVALEGHAEKAPPQQIEKEKSKDKGKQVGSGAETNKEKTETSGRMPIYKPPRRGAPAGRVAGGTRGPENQMPFLSVLSPDHVGLTVQEQPVLYWFISELTTYPIEFTIIPFWGVVPLLETRLEPPVQPGVQTIRLANYDIRLQPGEQYKWYVAIVPSREHRSKDIVTAGLIERSELSEAMRARLKTANKQEAVFIYAEAGIWYDALSSVSELIETAPDNTVFRKQRAYLLQQVDLPRIAQYETKHILHREQ